MEQQALDTLITGGIFLVLGIAIWARVSGMTIPELFKHIRDLAQDKSEETGEVIWNDQ